MVQHKTEEIGATSAVAHDDSLAPGNSVEPGAATETTGAGGTGRGKSRRHLLLLLIPLLFALIPLARYLLSDTTQEETLPASVVVANPVRGEVTESVAYSGIFEPESAVGVVPKIAGEVRIVHVGAGETVEAGDLVVTLDDERVALQAKTARSAWEAARAQYELALRGPRRQELANAQASLAQAESDLALAERNLERTRRLFEAGTVSRAEMEGAESKVESARTEVANSGRLVRLMEEGAGEEELSAARANAEAARQRYELAAIQQTDARVRAPVGGTIAEVMVEEGDTVGPGTPVASVINDSVLTASVAVPERQYGRVQRAGAGMRVVVRPIAYEEQLSFDARLVRIEPTVDPAGRTFAVEVAVDNAEGLLLPGMYATVELILRSIPDALLVPRTAVLTRNEQSVAFVVVEGNSLHARMVPVDVGVVSGDSAQIVSGLDAGDQVIVEGNTFLEEDQIVRVSKR